MSELAVNQDGLVHYFIEYTQGNIFMFQTEVMKKMKVKDSIVCFVTLPEIIKIGDKMRTRSLVQDFKRLGDSFVKECCIIEIDPNHHNYAYMLSKNGAYMTRGDTNNMIVVPENSKEKIADSKQILLHKAIVIINKHNFTSRMSGNRGGKPYIEYAAEIQIKETFKRNVVYMPMKEEVATASNPS